MVSSGAFLVVSGPAWWCWWCVSSSFCRRYFEIYFQFHNRMNQFPLVKPKPCDFGLTYEDLVTTRNNIKEIERLKRGGELSVGFTFLGAFILIFSVCLYGAFIKEIGASKIAVLGVFVIPIFLTCLIGMPIDSYFRKQKINALKSKIHPNYVLFLERYNTWKQEVEKERKKQLRYISSSQSHIKGEVTKTCALKKLIKCSGLEFEKRIYSIFISLGFDEVILTPPSDDGGIDVIAHRKGYKLAIQCKAHAKPSGPAPVRELYGVMCSEKFDFGLLINPSGFSSRAMEFAKGKNIILVDKEGLQKLLDRLPNNKKERNHA